MSPTDRTGVLMIVVLLATLAILVTGFALALRRAMDEERMEDEA